MSILDYFFTPAAPQISPAEAYQKHFEDDTPTLILDVRQPVETRSGTIPGAVLIPLTELGGRLEELPRDRQIIAICRSSHRSPLAGRRLKKAGFDVLDVNGGMQAWEAAGLPVTAE